MSEGNVRIMPGVSDYEIGVGRSPKETAKAARRFFLMEPMVDRMLSQARMGQYAAMTILNGDNGDAAKDPLWAFRQITADTEQLAHFYKRSKT
jgi:hypothetical protein